jgi:hypothetical protein
MKNGIFRDIKKSCKIWGHHGGDYEESLLLSWYVVWLWLDVSEECSVFFISVRRIGELGTNLAITSNWRIEFLRSVRRLLVTANVVPSLPIIVTLMMNALSSPNRPFLREPHGVTSEETPFFSLHYVHKNWYPVSGKYQVFIRSVRRLLVTANVVPSSPILVTLMMEALRSSETSVLTRVRRCNIPRHGILYIYPSSYLTGNNTPPQQIPAG